MRCAVRSQRSRMLPHPCCLLPPPWPARHRLFVGRRFCHDQISAGLLLATPTLMHICTLLWGPDLATDSRLPVYALCVASSADARGTLHVCMQEGKGHQCRSAYWLPKSTMTMHVRRCMHVIRVLYRTLLQLGRLCSVVGKGYNERRAAHAPLLVWPTGPSTLSLLSFAPFVEGRT